MPGQPEKLHSESDAADAPHKEQQHNEITTGESRTGGKEFVLDLLRVLPPCIYAVVLTTGFVIACLHGFADMIGALITFGTAAKGLDYLRRLLGKL